MRRLQVTQLKQLGELLLAGHKARMVEGDAMKWKGLAMRNASNVSDACCRQGQFRLRQACG